MTQEEETLFQEHLINCESCHNYLTSIRTLASIVGQDGLYINSPIKTHTHRINYWLSIAACFLLVIGISIFWHKKQDSENMLYPISVEHQNRAANEQIKVKLLLPVQDTIKIHQRQPVLFQWTPQSPFYLKIKYKNETLFEIDGNEKKYILPTETLTLYPYIDWYLTVDEQSYSGRIIILTNK